VSGDWRVADESLEVKEQIESFEVINYEV
nr:cell surface protein 2F5 91 kda component [Manduca sexta, Peptide Partial, 28 aa] [Manduca sexta]